MDRRMLQAAYDAGFKAALKEEPKVVAETRDVADIVTTVRDALETLYDGNFKAMIQAIQEHINQYPGPYSEAQARNANDWLRAFDKLLYSDTGIEVYLTLMEQYANQPATMPTTWREQF